jgi:hypothetical protein
MSDTPQERMMMYNNGSQSLGRVLVGGLGLGLYPQFAAVGAAGEAVDFTVIESSQVVRDIVEPTLSAALQAPLEVHIGDIEEFLKGTATTRYDTIFLDTWDTLDAVHLPRINRLRDLAVGHLASKGQVLLWGYRWMVRLFEDACRQLLKIAPDQREEWLTGQAAASQEALNLLMPVVEHFESQPVTDMNQSMAWCRQHIVLRAD